MKDKKILCSCSSHFTRDRDQKHIQNHNDLMNSTIGKVIKDGLRIFHFPCNVLQRDNTRPYLLSCAHRSMTVHMYVNVSVYMGVHPIHSLPEVLEGGSRAPPAAIQGFPTQVCLAEGLEWNLKLTPRTTRQSHGCQTCALAGVFSPKEESFFLT